MTNYGFSRIKRKGFGFSQNKKKVMDSHITKCDKLQILT